MNQRTDKHQNWNQEKQNKWKIDARSQADIEERIGELAASYVPEWNYQLENPDIGSVIARIFARQMSDNISRYNQVIDKYHVEFINMLGISLLPAKPALAMVLVKPVQDTIPGIEIYKGTRLLAETEDTGEPIIFETTHNLYVTGSPLEYVFMTKEKDGKIIPLKGDFAAPQFLAHEEESLESKNQEGAASLEEAKRKQLRAFRLFGNKEKGMEQNILLFYHSIVLDVENDAICIKITGNSKVIEHIKSGTYEFLYYTKEGLLSVENAEVLEDNETICLQKQQKSIPIELEGREYTLLVLLAKEPIRENVVISRIAASSFGRAIPPENVNNGSTDFDVREFAPFGDTLSLYQECYIGHDAYFRKAGSLIQIQFEVSYEEHRMLVSPQIEETQLKIIKRKPKTNWLERAANVYAEEISLEYFNGMGWKRLGCIQETRRLFADGNAGTYEISFLCPKDWEASGAGAYQGRCIRMQLLRADNCYMRPGIHHYPRIRNMCLSFSYEGHYVDAERLISIAGTRKLDLTKSVKEEKPITIFSKSLYTEDALYLGFSKKIESGPVSILFQLEDGIRFEGSRCRFEYSTLKGFKQMKVLDYTADMSRSGTVLFMPQADMQPVMLEGKRAYWIRVVRIRQEEEAKEEMLPIIRDICPNAVQVVNVHTREEEDFYLQESVAGMKIPLGVADILDMDVWVNERDCFSKSQMLQMLKETPEQVRVEYDMWGEISSFYVKWTETERFDDSLSRRCYMLDRMNSILVFGDGVQTEIPRVLDDVAFRAVIRCCNGEKGNVAAGQIHTAMNNLMFVDAIINPAKAYGGSSMESMHSALERGSNILHSRRRLVSKKDYIREIQSFSDAIDKVRCVEGQTIQGVKKEHALTFVILLKDFAVGSYSFHNIAGALKKHLKKSCELTVGWEDLHIAEPVFVKISVDLWAEVLHMEESFEMQELLKASLEQYLNPVSSVSGTGWEIGVMPKKQQLFMQLNMLKSKAIIKKMVVTARYTDMSGEHEVDLDDLQISPFMVCVNGRHHVNIIVMQR
uniref:hypothetical protein n=1 Tax=Agathobacter sp. TaxID=2021311 RepID=UPI0040576D0F